MLAGSILLLWINTVKRYCHTSFILNTFERTNAILIANYYEIIQFKHVRSLELVPL